MALIEARNSLLTAIGSIERRSDLLEKRPRAVRFSRATPKRAVRIRNRLLRARAYVQPRPNGQSVRSRVQYSSRLAVTRYTVGASDI
jgi:hypothetical protein